MQLEYFNELLATQSKESIKDVVMSIPSYYNYFQRKTCYDTIKLGNWNPLAFISENVAASLFHGREYSDETNKKMVLFYNLGSTSLEVSLIEYSTYKKIG